jgi:methylthioribose-1-phosphate isomerase
VKVNGEAQRTIWAGPEHDAVWIIDQRQLPHEWRLERLADIADVHRAIAEMWVRGAPLIGVAAAYGIALRCRRDASDDGLAQAKAYLDGARPTADRKSVV